MVTAVCVMSVPGGVVFFKKFLQYMLLNPQDTVDLFIFTEEIINGKLYFLCSGGMSACTI